jgi:predicted amidophosphoribosyltransferase
MAFSRRLELKTIHKMLSIYCHDMHGSTRGKLCPTCRQLLEYAGQRLDKCPYGENKPVCAKCPIHCYKAEQREAIRQVMRYSGPRMLWRSPVLTVRYMYRKKFKNPPGKKTEK